MAVEEPKDVYHITLRRGRVWRRTNIGSLGGNSVMSRTWDGQSEWTRGCATRMSCNEVGSCAHGRYDERERRSGRRRSRDLASLGNQALSI